MFFSCYMQGFLKQWGSTGNYQTLGKSCLLSEQRHVLSLLLFSITQPELWSTMKNEAASERRGWGKRGGYTSGRRSKKLSQKKPKRSAGVTMGDPGEGRLNLVHWGTPRRPLCQIEGSSRWAQAGRDQIYRASWRSFYGIVWIFILHLISANGVC